MIRSKDIRLCDSGSDPTYTASKIGSVMQLTVNAYVPADWALSEQIAIVLSRSERIEAKNKNVCFAASACPSK